MRAQRHSNRQAGYTLVEMLVALSLTGFLSTALLANVGMGARVWETVEDRSQQSAGGNVLDKVLRRHIRLAVPLTVGGAGGASGRQAVFFEGDSRGLRFFTEAGAGALPAGIYGVEIGFDEDHGDAVLRLRRARLAIGSLGEGQGVAWDESRLPLQFVGATFAYYGRQGGDNEADWHREWSGQRSLPDLVRLSFGGSEAGQSARSIVIAPAQDYSAATISARQFDDYFANIRG
jgi:general secretion pathway protein J